MADPTIAVLGTGPVARTLADRLAGLGRPVVLGSREPGDRAGTGHAVVSLKEAVVASDVVINATPGHASLAALTAIGPDAFAGRVLIDLANACTPAFDLVYPNSSLGERLQEALPGAKVVKTMNTAPIAVSVRPSGAGPGNVFLSGESAEAKAVAAGLLTAFGWPAGRIIDLGGIRSARGPEHYFLMVPPLAGVLGGPAFNIGIIRT